MKLSASARRMSVVLPMAVAGVLAAAVLAGAQGPTLADNATGHDHGPPEVRPLTQRSTSPDDIRAQLRLRLDGRGPTHVMNMHDVDTLQLLELTFEPGEVVNWHVHPGPVIVIVDEGVLTVTSADDCVARDYGPSEVYIEQGPGDVLRVENLPEATDDAVIYALFFQLPAEGPLTIFEEDPGC
jgi:hypothetical protein